MGIEEPSRQRWEETLCHGPGHRPLDSSRNSCLLNIVTGGIEEPRVRRRRLGSPKTCLKTTHLGDSIQFLGGIFSVNGAEAPEEAEDEDKES